MIPSTPTSSAEPALTASALRHRYRAGRPPSIDGVTLTIDQPGITGLVGPNGAGKSTLLKIWSGLEAPTAGSARVGGFDPWRQRSQVASRLGYLPQTPALYRSLSVRDHLDLARTERADFDVALARRYLEQLRVPIEARASELSGGQRAQVSLALVLGTRSQIILLDEPLANLDPLARREFLQILMTAVREAASIALLSSHVVSDIEEVCSRLVVLGNGAVLLDGAIADLRATHRVGAAAGLPPPDGSSVAAFAGRDGQARVLFAVDAGWPPNQADVASLEDIVVGYLALGRPREPA